MTDLPNVRKFLDLSTSHLPAVVFRDLNAIEGVTMYDFDMGAFLWVPSDVDEHLAEYQGREGDDPDPDDEEFEPIPDSVVTIWRYARGLGCDYILLDRDAPRDPRLPAWEW